MSVYTVYDPSTGDIKFNLIGTVVDGDVPDGMEVAEGRYDSQQYYFESGQFTERPVMNLTYPSDPVPVGEYFRVENIPEGATLIAPGEQEVKIDDGFFEWTTDIPGTYEFTLTKFPCMPVTVNATFS